MSTTSQAEYEVAQFKSRSRQFYWLATLALAAISCVVLLTLGVVVARGGVMQAGALQRLALSWAPVPFYVWALWKARGLFAELSRRGFAFHGLVSEALKSIGWSLSFGAFVSIGAAPVIWSIGPRAYGSFAIFNVPALTLGIVGLALVAVSGVIRQAARVEAKNAFLQSALEEFF